ncbi:OmpA family protein [Phaeobacter sp. J2-8]|uniref:OmpA family protein n=1 Tax=Phaeobacter sp. J2-8 TaxID=2931394 RepID=UPI001FD504F4|nr:OmpA family protein [Phaeobacter sp. J2-8]MCJ7871804.1 OmpA family protein [Phaeobacter sp. J2-8]
MISKNSVFRAALIAASLHFASAASAQSVQQEGCTLSVFFPINVSTPTGSQAAAIAAFAQGAQTGIIAINGFSSSIGSPSYNQALSQARAQSVGNVVVAAGHQVAAQGFGELGPGAANQRTDVVRDDCATEVAVGSGPGVWLAPAAGLGLLLLGGAGSSSSSSSSSTTGTP